MSKENNIEQHQGDAEWQRKVEKMRGNLITGFTVGIFPTIGTILGGIGGYYAPTLSSSIYNISFSTFMGSLGGCAVGIVAGIPAVMSDRYNNFIAKSVDKLMTSDWGSKFVARRIQRSLEKENAKKIARQKTSEREELSKNEVLEKVGSVLQEPSIASSPVQPAQPEQEESLSDFFQRSSDEAFVSAYQLHRDGGMEARQAAELAAKAVKVGNENWDISQNPLCAQLGIGKEKGFPSNLQKEASAGVPRVNVKSALKV